MPDIQGLSIGQPVDAPEPGPEPFYPSLFDVFKVRHVLRWKIKPNGIPVELVDLIVDTAEYWPSIKTSMNVKTII